MELVRRIAAAAADDGRLDLAVVHLDKDQRVVDDGDDHPHISRSSFDSVFGSMDPCPYMGTEMLNRAVKTPVLVVVARPILWRAKSVQMS